MNRKVTIVTAASRYSGRTGHLLSVDRNGTAEVEFTPGRIVRFDRNEWEEAPKQTLLERLLDAYKEQLAAGDFEAAAETRRTILSIANPEGK